MNRNLKVGLRDNDKGQDRIRYLQVPIKLLTPEGDLGISLGKNVDLLPPGTILVNLEDQVYVEGEDWLPHRFASSGTALLMIRSLMAEAEQRLKKPKLIAAERKYLLYRRQRMSQFEKTLAPYEASCLTLLKSDDPPMEDLQRQIGIRPYYSWLQLMILFKKERVRIRWQNVTRMVLAREELDCLHQVASVCDGAAQHTLPGLAKMFLRLHRDAFKLWDADGVSFKSCLDQLELVSRGELLARGSTALALGVALEVFDEAGNRLSQHFLRSP